MLRCTRCEGFLPADVSACPNCSKFVPRGRAGAGFLSVLGAGAAAITLMACYGMPPCVEKETADGGLTNNCTSVVEKPDAGATDAGTTCDAGTSTDGGCN